MNGLILDNHCARIEDTPFKMCLHIGKPLQICNPILLEMLKHWLPAYESFRVMQWSIPFSCADICMCLALSIIDVDVEFDKNVCEVVDSLMKDKLITIENVIDMIKSVVHSDFDDVDNVCRLYIFVCFMVLYFLRNSKIVSNIHCNVLDHIYRLSRYNWGKTVHSYLVKSLSCAFLALGLTEICLSGSTSILQVHSTLCNDYFLFVLYFK